MICRPVAVDYGQAAASLNNFNQKVGQTHVPRSTISATPLNSPSFAVYSLVVSLIDGDLSVGFRARLIAPPIFETDRFGRWGSDPVLDHCRTKSMQWVIDQAANLALAEVSLAVVLLMDEHGHDVNASN